MRSIHYWRKAGAASAPANIVVFDCETTFGPAAAIDGGELQTLRMGVAIAYRLEKGKRTRVKRLVFRTADEFWQLVLSRLDKRRPIWVFAHNIAYDLGCVGGWLWLRKNGYKTRKAAVSTQLFYLKGTVNGSVVIFCDTLNYFRCSLASLGKSVGLPKLDMPPYDAPDSVWEHYCANDVEVAARGVDKLIGFGREHLLGPWQPSIAGLSFSAFRSTFMQHQVLVHGNRAALDLERKAYCGGVVDIPVIEKKITGPIYELDVCSMYPHCCTLSLPTKIKGDGRRYGIRGIKNLAKNYLVFAEVDIETDKQTYPVKQRRGTYYPTGRFRTALAHPELMLAIANNDVREVHYVAFYEHAPIFRGYMEWMIDKKIHYERAADDAFRTVCKYYGNNLYGKTGQMTPRWQEWGKASLMQLEEIHGLKPGALELWYNNPPTLYLFEELFRFPMIPLPIEVRDMYGCVELKVRETESRESCPAIAATVTSYARLILRSYQQIAGVGNWFYSDTDSIWVNERGRRNLMRHDCVRQDTLGYLSEKGIHNWLVVHGPKDYETDTTVKRKGIRPNAVVQPDGGFKQLQFPSALTQIRDGHTDGVFVRHITKHLRRTITRVRVNPDGTTRPLLFPSENPEGGKR